MSLGANDTPPTDPTNRSQLQRYLEFVQNQADLFESAWFATARVCTNAEPPKLPSMNPPGLPAVESGGDPPALTAIPLDELQRISEQYARYVGYVAFIWNRHVDEAKNALRLAEDSH